MKKINIFAFAFLVALAIPTACQKETTLESTPAEEAVSHVTRQTFVCSFAEPDTKMSLATDGKTAWAVGDRILIHGEYIGTKSSKQYSTIVELAAGDIIEEGKKALISFDVDEAGIAGIKPYVRDGYSSTFYAVYPADAHDQTSGKHVYNYDYFVNTNKPLMAAYNRDGKFVFKHVVAAIDFSIPNTFDFDEVMFQGNNNEVIGFNSYVLKYGYATGGWEEIEIPKTDSSGELTSITIPAVCDGTTRHIIYLTPSSNGSGIAFTKGFTLKFIKNGAVEKYASNKNNFELNMGDYLNLGTINSSYIKTYSPPAHVPASWTSTAEDLSAKPANSYLIYHSDVVPANAGKAFKIAAVQGNSATSVGAIESAEVFWETYSVNSDPSVGSVVASVDFDADYVYFKMPASMHTGNAVIAVRNSANRILWSWHIWVPGTTIDTDTYGDVAGCTLMDRNLGALVAAPNDAQAPIESFGLLYQWGRKDPFLGGKKYETYPSKTPVTRNAPALHDGKYSMVESIQNPNYYAYVNGDSDSDWNSTSSATLWNAAGDVKTQNDPCPYGYRVPLFNESKAMWIKTDTDWTFNKDNTNYWFTFSTSGAIFPYTGYYDCWGGSLSEVTNRAIIWSANESAVGPSYGACMEARRDKTTIFYSIKNAKAKAGSVRCCVYAAEP